MFRRLLLGLVIGVFVGVAAAAGLVSGLHVVDFSGALGPLVAYGAAGATGAFTGLFAGKPIWAAGAKTEAGLKAFFGALFAAAVMFALRQWAQSWTLDLSVLHAGGPAAVGALPGASLPLIAALLGGLLELDNSDDDAGPSQPKRVQARVSASTARAAGETSEPGEDDDEQGSPAASRRARR